MMRCFNVWVLCFLTTFTQSVFSATHGDILQEAISEKFVKLGGDKNIITDAIVNRILNIYAPVSNGFDNDLCRNHGKSYKAGVKNGEIWALKMFDSSSKFPEGFLMGNWGQLGNYDECIGIEDVPSEFGAFSGQHCLVIMSPWYFTDEQQSTREEIKKLNMAFANRGLGAVYPFVEQFGKSFQWSICVPSSCRAKDVQQNLEATLPSNLAVNVEEIRCTSRATDPPFSAADWFAVGFMSFFAILVVLSTSYDLMHLHSESRQPVLAAFSVYSNGAKLLSSPTSSPDNLACLHGVRVLSIAWIMLGHRYSFASNSPSINRIMLLEVLQDWKHMFIVNATVSVDSFFLLSGIVVCYVFMREMQKGASFNIFLYYIHRYVRLTPAYAVVILLTATLFQYMGDGPLWKQKMAIFTYPCQDKWWIGLLYVNNYIRPIEQCVGPAWYIAVDMQLFWLSPLVLLPLWKWPKFGKALLGVLIGVGLLIAFLISYIYKFPGTSESGEGAGAMEYYPMHTRFTPYLIGIGLGYILHKTKRTTIRLSKPLVALGWFLSFGLMLTSLLLAHRFFQLDHQYERAFESIYTCFMRPAWALGLAWVVFACVKGYGGFIDTFLSWSFFQVLSRLVYSIFLIHYTFMIWDYGSIKAPIYLSDRTVFLQYFGDWMIVLPAAFLLSVVFEAPAIIIERHFLGRLDKKSSPPAKKEDASKSPQDLGEADKEATIEHQELSAPTQSTTQPV